MKFETEEEQSTAFKDFYQKMSSDFEESRIALQRDLDYLRAKGILKAKGQPASAEEWEKQVKFQLGIFIKRRERILINHTEIISRPDYKKGQLTYELIFVSLDARDDFKKYITKFGDFLKVPYIEEFDKKLLKIVETLSELILQEYLDKNLNLEKAGDFGFPYDIDNFWKE